MTVIDTDSHLREEYFLDEVFRLEGEFADKTPRKVKAGEIPEDNEFEYEFHPWTKAEDKAYGHHWIYHPKHKWLGGEIAERQIGGWDMDVRVQHNAEARIDKQFLFPTGITTPALYEGPLGGALCRAYNNWARELVRGKETQLYPVGIMPAGHPESMPAEAERCVKELGFKALHLACFTKSRTMDDEAYHPFYETAERLGVPLFCHPNSRGPSQSKFRSFYPIHVLGRPFNCAMALIALTVGGVFEKFPGLKVSFFECSAEYPLYWMHRIDDDYDYMRHDFCSLKRNPSEWVRTNCYFTCEADELPMTNTIEQIGADHILFASDYPHFDSEYPDTVKTIAARKDITPKQAEMILGRNAEALLNL
jgi:hypothetical protein